MPAEVRPQNTLAHAARFECVAKLPENWGLRIGIRQFNIVPLGPMPVYETNDGLNGLLMIVRAHQYVEII